MNLQTLFHNRQTLLQEQEQVLQQLQAEDATSEDLKDLQQRL